MSRVCVNIACGASYVDGWVNLDYSPSSPAVTKANLLERLPLDAAAVDVLYSSHFVEHIPRKQLNAFLAECHRVLKSGGQIRLVLPDLDELCREYLRRRDAGEHEKADFVVLEMLDQCVRAQPGGDLAEYYRHIISAHVQDMVNYITTRTGEDFSGWGCRTEAESRPRWLQALLQPSRLWARIERLYCQMVTALLPAAFRAQNVSFAFVGERHAWVYDFHSLSGLLEQAGFVHVRRQHCNQTEIVEFPLYPLDINQDGLPRKGQGSMYLEARKP